MRMTIIMDGGTTDGNDGDDNDKVKIDYNLIHTMITAMFIISNINIIIVI